MDGRDQPDTNVVRIRRSGDPSEAERRRLASTIFAEEDDVGTFSRGNLVPPPTDHPTEPRDDDRANAADPYFERLQRTRGGHRQIATAARSDSETIAYFDRLATQSPAEMSANGTPSPAATPMPGSALLPAELTRPSRHRSRRHDRLIPFAPAIRLWATLRRSRLAWPLSTATLGVLAALGAGIAVIGQTSSRGSKQRLSQHAAGATFLAPIRQDVLAASVDPFGAKAVVPRSVTHVPRPHQAGPEAMKSHLAVTRTSTQLRTTIKYHVVTTQYTPTRGAVLREGAGAAEIVREQQRRELVEAATGALLVRESRRLVLPDQSASFLKSSTD